MKDLAGDYCRKSLDRLLSSAKEGETHSKELTLHEDLGDDDPTAVHAILELLLDLPVH